MTVAEVEDGARNEDASLGDTPEILQDGIDLEQEILIKDDGAGDTAPIEAPRSGESEQSCDHSDSVAAQAADTAQVNAPICDPVGKPPPTLAEGSSEALLSLLARAGLQGHGISEAGNSLGAMAADKLDDDERRWLATLWALLDMDDAAAVALGTAACGSDRVDTFGATAHDAQPGLSGAKARP
ncbi:MAG: hypothetical protein AAF416_07325 [Pseudomonadota bacterium]